MTNDEIAHWLQRSMNGSFMKPCSMSGPVFYLFYPVTMAAKQVINLLLQFYYGDINLARDKFLQEQIKLDDGCIFSILCCHLLVYLLGT